MYTTIIRMLDIPFEEEVIWDTSLPKPLRIQIENLPLIISVTLEGEGGAFKER